MMDLSDLKELQKDVIRKSRRINVIFILIWILTMITIYYKNLIQLFSYNIYLFDTAIVLILATMVRHIILNKKIKLFENEFKKIFVLSSLSQIFEKLNYLPDKGLNEEVISDTKMMNMGDLYSSNDYFEAEYKGIRVKQADVTIEEKRETTDSDGHTQTHYINIFRGKWMIFDFNKTFNFNIQVCQKEFTNSKIPYWGEQKNYQKVTMEDEEFNKMFSVYAQDAHEAFYILTPQFMEKIKKLVSNIKGTILLCFIDHELHIGLDNNEDSFEYDIYKPIEEGKIKEKLISEIKVITDFIEELNLDDNLFRREV